MQSAPPLPLPRPQVTRRRQRLAARIDAQLRATATLLLARELVPAGGRLGDATPAQLRALVLRVAAHGREVAS